MGEDLKQEVLDAVEGAELTSDSDTSKEVPLSDVKEVVEEPTEKKAEEPKTVDVTPAKDVSKMEEQLSNLNKALQIERDEAKKLKEKMSSFEEPLNKLKGVFSPQEQKKEEVEPKFLTQEDIDSYYESKKQEEREEAEKKQRAEQIEKEIDKLEKEWDGTDGKPKYDDEKVINWQRDNNKLYLSPEEAFFAMNKSELIDYEVKRKLS